MPPEAPHPGIIDWLKRDKKRREGEQNDRPQLEVPLHRDEDDRERSDQPLSGIIIEPGGWGKNRDQGDQTPDRGVVQIR